MKEEVLYDIFLYIYKEYDALERERCLCILAGYGVGLCALCLVRTYRGCLTVASKVGGYQSIPLKVSGG